MDKKEKANLEKLLELSKSEGGKYLIENQKKVVMSVVDNLANNYQDRTHSELITLCAKLSANLSLLQLLSGIDKQIKAIEEVLEEEK